MFSVRGFEASFSLAGTLGCMVCLAPQLFLPVYLHANVGTAQSTSHCLASPGSPPGCWSLPLLPVWMNVSLTPRLSDFHTVWFSVSSGCFLILNLLLFFIWLCEDEQCVYLHLHLGQKSTFIFSIKNYSVLVEGN